MRVIKLLFCIVFLATVANAASAAPKVVKSSAGCVRPTEVPLLQLTTLQQELMDAALTCGVDARKDYNQFQTDFGSALRQADGRLAAVFKRVYGRAGLAAHNRFKTDMASAAELRRLQNAPAFCAAAAEKAAGALALASASVKSAVKAAALLRYAGSQVSPDTPWPVTLCAR